MNNRYVFVPKNPILRHCSDSFSTVLKAQADSSTVIHCSTIVNLKTIWHLLCEVVRSQPNAKLSIFFLAVQSDYLVLLYLLKLAARLFSRNLKAYYLMHEPRLEKGRVNPIKSFIIFAHQFLFGCLADVILLPSNEAVTKAETFVNKDRIRELNLTFLSVPQATLEKNLHLLKCTWDTRKVFSMLGTASSLDKNPQGFLDFANIFNQLYPGEAEFIRGGRDRNINIHYPEEVTRFPCYLSETTKDFLFNLSHFVIVPYSISTQSGVLIEALSHGKNLIINDIPAFHKFKEFNFVMIVDFSSKASILNCIKTIQNISFDEYELCYWSAIEYFRRNHSESYLENQLSTFL